MTTRWILLHQEFNLEIKDKARVDNVIADHFSRLIVESHDAPIDDTFPYEHPIAISMGQAAWFAEFVKNLALGIFSHDPFSYQKKKFLYGIKIYF